MQLITKEFDHWRLDPRLRRLLDHCRSQARSQYAIDRLGVEPGWLATTDSRQLISYGYQHEIETGLYFMCRDGFLLKDEEAAKFPEWRHLLLNENNSIGLAFKGGLAESNEVLSVILRHGVYFHLNWMRQVLQLLKKLGASVDEIRVTSESPNGPVMLNGDCSVGHFTYLLMGIKPAPWAATNDGPGGDV